MTSDLPWVIFSQTHPIWIPSTHSSFTKFITERKKKIMEKYDWTILSNMCHCFFPDIDQKCSDIFYDALFGPKKVDWKILQFFSDFELFSFLFLQFFFGVWVWQNLKLRVTFIRKIKKFFLTLFLFFTTRKERYKNIKFAFWGASFGSCSCSRLFDCYLVYTYKSK